MIDDTKVPPYMLRDQMVIKVNGWSTIHYCQGAFCGGTPVDPDATFAEHYSKGEAEAAGWVERRDRGWLCPVCAKND